MSVEAIAGKWHDQLLRTDPVDRAAAQAAVQEAYRAAGIVAPERFLWCTSPLEAVWGVLVIVGKTEGYNHAVYGDIERLKTGNEKLANARAWVADRLGIGEKEVEGYFGQPFYRSNGTNPVTARLRQNHGAWMARAQAGDAFLAPHAGGPFKPLHDLEQALHFEGERRGSGALYKEALKAGGGKQVAILGGRSAQHRLYGNLAFLEVAVDEALAETGSFQPTELQRALWSAYEDCGMWWPCEHGVVFAERPAASELAADGPRMEWADGFIVGGKPEGRTAETSAVVSAETPSLAAIELARKLPSEHAARIAFLREHSQGLPFFDRYLGGEHKQVWEELVALGQAALDRAHAADTLAVVYETIHRVDHDIRLIAERLKQIGYRFVYPGSNDGFLGLRKPKAHEPHVAALADVRDKIAQLEQAARGPIPLSLRAFFEVVGEVNLNGDHPALAPPDADLPPDPLMVCGVEDAIAMVKSEDRDEEEPLLVEFAPDALHKANISGGAPYSIALSGATVDARVEDEPHGTSFVEYLRIALLRWGGFPGWENASAPPPELADLRRDLVPF